MKIDFKKYHVRGMNSSEEEKLVINAELKELYESLNEDEKKVFNEDLQTFLIKEMATIKSVYDGVKTGNSEN